MIQKLDNILSEILKNEKIAGMCVAVTDRRKLIYKKGFGCESTERAEVPTHPDALYRVASVTKIVTGFTIVKLAEMGILSLDTPICEYVPWLCLPQNAHNIITLRMLLSHTAGLPTEYTPDGPKEESALEDSLKAELENVTMAFYPNDGKYLYSNLGIRLASYIAEVKTGLRYSELAWKYVLNPIGMSRSTYDLRVASTYPLSLPHTEKDGILLPDHYIKENAARLGAGGLYSNTEDLAKLARCMLNKGQNDSGEEILCADAVEEMLKPIATPNGENINGYGITMMQKTYPRGVMYGHLGDASPYGSSVMVDFEKGIGVITLMNTFRSEQRTKIPEIIMEMYK